MCLTVAYVRSTSQRYQKDVSQCFVGRQPVPNLKCEKGISYAQTNRSIIDWRGDCAGGAA